MRRMVELRGGIRSDTPWEQFMTSVVTAFDLLWTFVLSSDPQTSPVVAASAAPSLPLRNEIPVYANHPFPPDYAASLSRIPDGFSNLAVASLLSVQCVRIIERIPHEPIIPSTTGNTLSSQRGRSTARSTELHSILTDLLKLTSLSITKMEHLLCHGLVAYCLPLQYGTPLPISTTRTLQSCVETYMALNLSENEEKLDGKCLLWIAVVIASCLDMCSDSSLRNAPVLERILNKFPQAREWTKVDTILRTFLWHEDLSEQWYRTWQGVLARRKSPPSGFRSSPQAFSPITVVGGASPGYTMGSERPGCGGSGSSESPRAAVPEPAEPRQADARSMKVASLLHND
ncbi:uncharacterized protein HMPREF1541_07716 [Cyphellophora europaea CBS 101466]|uniref:Uncharacterized protein n=1 Tax=Cyphellophora europaea (strain CBS 101466) TaxID=1220924 RepID=W2RNP8_CYPE1|nr:uncharacterized protein HMPREF1541_07716 [Cyphellophora europaea CBS 101466]ETN38092.1 hypothetical protein HMPREF1541_07716 [Cyphellophora europaea CBS 101466]